MNDRDICPNCDHVQANVNNDAWARPCRGCGWDKRVMPHPDPDPAEVVALGVRCERLEDELRRYKASLFAHHEISTLSESAIAESIGGTCRICQRAQDALAATEAIGAEA